MRHINWFSVILISSAVGLSLCFAHSSSHCKARTLRCQCDHGGHVRIKVKQCRSGAGLCQPCEGIRSPPCDDQRVSGKCSRRLKTADSPPVGITYFSLDGNQPATAGSTVNLTCNATALYGLILFRRSGQIVYEDQRITYFQLAVSDDRNNVKTALQIKNLSAADSGKYECVVVSLDGLVWTKSLNLTVLGGSATVRIRRSASQTIGCVKNRVHVNSNQTGPPSVTISAKAKTGFVDDNIIIKCTDRSNPPANITWLFDGAPLTSTQEKRYARESCNELLIIRHAEIGDTGTFTCIATNEYGNSSESISVNVLARYDREPHIGTFELEGERCKALLGGSVNVTCQASSAYAVTILGPGGEQVEPKKGRYALTHPPTGSSHVVELKLEIKNVSSEDAGNYTCAAVGMSFSITKELLLLRIVPCPKDHYCPVTGNQAFRCPDGTCNDGSAPAVHQCYPCAERVLSSGGESEARQAFPVELTSLIVLCALLVLVLLVVAAVYRYYQRRRGIPLGRVGSSDSHDHCTFKYNSKVKQLVAA